MQRVLQESPQSRRQPIELSGDDRLREGLLPRLPGQRGTLCTIQEWQSLTADTATAIDSRSMRLRPEAANITAW